MNKEHPLFQHVVDTVYSIAPFSPSKRYLGAGTSFDYQCIAPNRQQQLLNKLQKDPYLITEKELAWCLSLGDIMVTMQAQFELTHQPLILIADEANSLYRAMIEIHHLDLDKFETVIRRSVGKQYRDMVVFRWLKLNYENSHLITIIHNPITLAYDFQKVEKYTNINEFCKPYLINPNAVFEE